jgi:hypothetical protein
MHPNVMVVRAVNSQVGVSSRLEQPDFWKFGLGASVILLEHGDVDEVGGLKRPEFSVARLISIGSFPMTGLGCPAQFGSYSPQAR